MGQPVERDFSHSFGFSSLFYFLKFEEMFKF
jgi:hypothetical protein